jgi:hypothetical protein
MHNGFPQNSRKEFCGLTSGAQTTSARIFAEHSLAKLNRSNFPFPLILEYHAQQRVDVAHRSRQGRFSHAAQTRHALYG